MHTAFAVAMGLQAAAGPAPDPFMGVTRIRYTIYLIWHLAKVPELPTDYVTVPFVLDELKVEAMTYVSRSFPTALPGKSFAFILSRAILDLLQDFSSIEAV